MRVELKFEMEFLFSKSRQILEDNLLNSNTEFVLISIKIQQLHISINKLYYSQSVLYSWSKIEIDDINEFLMSTNLPIQAFSELYDFSGNICTGAAFCNKLSDYEDPHFDPEYFLKFYQNLVGVLEGSVLPIDNNNIHF